jgi:hypothetical protein
MPEE